MEHIEIDNHRNIDYCWRVFVRRHFRICMASFVVSLQWVHFLPLISWMYQRSFIFQTVSFLTVFNSYSCANIAEILHV